MLNTLLSIKQWTSRGNKQDPIECIKETIGMSKRKWVDELPRVLWAYRITSRQPTGATPFPLAYRMEAIILTEIGMLITKIFIKDRRDNDEELIKKLDWADKM